MFESCRDRQIDKITRADRSDRVIVVERYRHLPRTRRRRFPQFDSSIRHIDPALTPVVLRTLFAALRPAECEWCGRGCRG